MTVQITIIGLGQTGASVGLALAAHKDQLYRVGHDIDPTRARQAEKLGAVDAIHYNLPAAVEKADLVVLALPVDQIQPTLEVIAPVLRPEAVVVDLAPVKQVVMEWARQILPPDRYYIGLAAVRNPLYLDTPEAELDTPHADFFRQSLIAVVAPPDAPAEAHRLATDLTSLLGAEHMFIDPGELDGLVAATHILPNLLSSALVQATIPQPGWREARKLADQAYAAVTRPAAHPGTAAALTRMALNAPENTLRVLDNAIDALQSLRTLVAEGDAQALENYFEQARQNRLTWWEQRSAGNWSKEGEPKVEPFGTGMILSRLLGINRPKRPKT